MEVSGVCIIFKCTEGYKKLHHPYYIHMVHEMKAPEKVKHIIVCRLMCSLRRMECTYWMMISLMMNHSFTLMAAWTARIWCRLLEHPHLPRTAVSSYENGVCCAVSHWHMARPLSFSLQLIGNIHQHVTQFIWIKLMFRVLVHFNMLTVENNFCTWVNFIPAN